MNTLLTEIQVANGEDVHVTEDTLTVDLADGRTIAIPLAWYPRLFHGTIEERNRWEWIGNNEGIYWPNLDEDIGVEGMLLGKKSGESAASLARWLEGRAG